MDQSEDLPTRVFGWSDMFVKEDDDPRTDGGWDNDERSILRGFLADRRLTLELKCSGLNEEQMTRPSVPPSDLTLLGLVRHLTFVENYWFQSVVAGRDTEAPYRDANGSDAAFVVDARATEASWSAWRDEVARSEEVTERIVDYGQRGVGKPVPVREVMVHVIREYAQHLGHADLLRERIDGRVGQ